MQPQIFVSTTFHEVGQTRIEDVLNLLQQTDQDGIELGSTHIYDEHFLDKVISSGHKNFIVHNYCPPAPQDLILNIASPDKKIRESSLQHIEKCLQFAKEVGASLYTFHPGFLSDALSTGHNEKNYDFEFSEERTNYEIAMNFMHQSMEKIIPMADSYGIPIAIETEGSVRKADVLLMQTPQEYSDFFERYQTKIGINLNLAHTSLAAKVHGFSFDEFYQVVKDHLLAIEISHCDLEDDQHKVLEPGSYVFELVDYLKINVPLILEFRNSTISQVQDSISMLRSALN